MGYFFIIFQIPLAFLGRLWYDYSINNKDGDNMSQRSDRILHSIQRANLSYSELASLTKIPKSALQRYATGETEKIPIDRIEAIAKATNVTSEFLMCWTDNIEPETTNNYNLSDNEKNLLLSFNQLNETGQSKLMERLDELLELPKYRK